MNPRSRLLCGCAAAILFPALASAQSATLTQLPSQSTAYTVTVDALPASPVTGYSNVQEFTVSNQSPPTLGLPAELNLFCVELGQDAKPSANFSILPIGQADENRASNSIDAYAGIPSTGIGTGSGATLGGRALKLEQLYGYVFGAAYTNSSPLSIDLTAAGVTGSAAYDSAVFQLAAWQIAEANTFTGIATSGTNGSGFFVPSASSGLVADADKLLLAVSNDPTVALLNLDVIHNDSVQDYILPDPNGIFVQVPEPGAASAVLGLAAVALAAWRRRTGSSPIA